MPNKPVEMKVILLGDGAAGKTSLFKRVIQNKFTGDTEPYASTVQVDYGLKRTKVMDQEVELILWDTAGGEHYDSMSRMYYRDATASIVCFDITVKKSFEKAKFWIEELKENDADCWIGLCGCKSDLDTNRTSNKQLHDASAFAKKNNIRVFETSSKTGDGVAELINHIAFECLHRASKKTPRLDDKEPAQSKCC